MKTLIAGLTCALWICAPWLPAAALADTDPAVTIGPGTGTSTGTGALGAIGVAVDDGMGYGDGAAAARTPAYVVQALQASGQFVSAELNRLDLPQQLRVKIRKKPTGSEEAAAGKLIAGAATLFLLPMQQSYDYSFDFEVECRGRSMGEWQHRRTVEQTQFLLADPHRSVQGLVQEAVAQFIQQAVASGKLAAGCR